jgi:hypothetical protein
MRWTWLAKLETITRPGVVRNTGDGEAGDLGVRGVDKEQVHALLAQAGERTQVGDAAVEGELVHLEVAGVQHEPGRGADGDRQAVRDRVVHRDELAVEGAELLPLALTHLDGLRGDAVLLELGLDEGQGEPRADDRDVGSLAQQVGDAADVVLVAVGEHHGVDAVEPVPDPGEVRQDHVDAGLVLLGEQDAAVDDQEPAVMLEHGHVAADLAETAERNDPQPARGQVRQAAALAP